MALQANTGSNHFDVIVLGVGSMGAATCYYLAKAGLKVLGVEQFDIVHGNGSHAGQSRIIRKAYFEHPDYVPLLNRAYENWQELEAICNTQLYQETGVLYFGPPQNGMMQGVIQSAEQYGIPVQTLSSEEITRNHPQFKLPEDYIGLYEANAGFIPPEKAILLYAEQAIRLGAVLKTNEKVIRWKQEAAGSIVVESEKGHYSAAKLVITAGPWVGQLLPELQTHLKVTRQILAWVIPQNPGLFELGQLPCWMIADETNEQFFYGFPILPVARFHGPIGFKAGFHQPGKISDPDQVERKITLQEEQQLVAAFQRFFPEGYLFTSVLKTCLYTYTRDENFIIDFLPGSDQNVVFAAGFSGHGFKFASVIGEVLADLCTKRSSALPIDFLNFSRIKV